MCGIVGYIGTREASDICLQGLRRLEYRGYDSAGIAVIGPDGALDMRRAVGKLDHLQAALSAQPLHGTVGIGHTRWATHGKPSVANSHPHLSSRGRVAVVHNGIIENYQDLRARLTADGMVFRSQTDTEVMAHLVERYLDGDLRAAVCRAVRDLRGAFAFGVMSVDSPDELVAVRRRSPLVVGVGDGENYIASDMPAIRPETNRVYVIDDDEVARVTRAGVELTDLDGHPLRKEIYQIPWAADAAGKGAHRHFMRKEIHEQPEALYACLAGRLTDADTPVNLDGLGLDVEALRRIQHVVFTACGTAFHAGLVGRFVMERLAGIPASAELAAELHTRRPLVAAHTLVVAVSQSGETMDTLLALRHMRGQGAKVIAICNVVDSTIARESDGVVYIQAGPEIGVASTKAYTLQLMTILLLAVHLAEARGTAGASPLREIKEALLRCPEQARALLAREDDIRRLAEKYWNLSLRVWAELGVAIERPDEPVAASGYWAGVRRRDALRPNAFYLARGVHLPAAMEGALKLKEISYLHAEAYSAGEMKHGPIALIEPAMFTVAIAPQGEVRDQMIGNIMEIKARSGPVIVVATEGDTQVEQAGVDRGSAGESGGQAHDMIWIPACPELVAPVLTAIPLQLFAYHIADLRGEHIDQPRNLAKTVTVE